LQQYLQEETVRKRKDVPASGGDLKQDKETQPE
jgi:hypothetical protein